MKCQKCGAKIQEQYADFVASYDGYVERYVNCWECKTVNVVRYEETKIAGTYPMTRYQDNTKNEK